MAAKKEESWLEYKALAELPPWPRNPKLHDRDATKESLRRFGFTAPVLLDEDTGRLVAGHGRIEALQELQEQGEDAPKRVRVRKDGAWMIPVVRGLTFENAQEAEAYLLADNRLVEKGGWDDAMLKAILEDLQQAGADDSTDKLLGLGWSEREVAALVRQGDDDRLVGPTPDEKLDRYINAAIRQVTLLFAARDYDAVVERLGRAQAQLGVTDHTSVVLKLLDLYESGALHGAAKTGAAAS